MNIGYKLVKNNMPATAEKAPYLGMAVPVGSLAYDNILKDMIKTGTRLSLPTARFFLEAFYEFAAERIAEEVVRINTGTVAIYPMIDGSFDSEDAEFDPARNSLYVGATLSQSLRDRVAGIVPDSSGESAGGTVKMDRIYDLTSKLRGVITGTDAFRISGRNLTVPDAEDESLALYAKDGVTKVADIVVSETDEGQWIICQLAGTVAVPKGTYKVRIASHGLDPTDPLTVATLTVTLVEAIPAPGPEPLLRIPEIGVVIDRLTEDGGGAPTADGLWAITGENLHAFYPGDGGIKDIYMTIDSRTNEIHMSCNWASDFKSAQLHPIGDMPQDRESGEHTAHFTVESAGVDEAPIADGHFDITFTKA